MESYNTAYIPSQVPPKGIGVAGGKCEKQGIPVSKIGLPVFKIGLPTVEHLTR